MILDWKSTRNYYGSFLNRNNTFLLDSILVDKKFIYLFYLPTL